MRLARGVGRLPRVRSQRPGTRRYSVHRRDVGGEETLPLTGSGTGTVQRFEREVVDQQRLYIWYKPLYDSPVLGREIPHSMVRPKWKVAVVSRSVRPAAKAERDVATANRTLTRPTALHPTVSSRSDHHGDETYREEEPEDRGWFPTYPSWGWGGGWGLPPLGVRSEKETPYDEEPHKGAGESPDDEADSESLWDEGLITLLIVSGAILFLFPEPVTSGIGILLLFMGVVGWLVDLAL